MTAFDAQFSMARILKPWPNFESRYQGQSADIPVAFPGVLDRLAGKPGYDPYLLAGLPVPLGARIMIWLPLCFVQVDDNTVAVAQAYQYQILWRLRSIGDFVALQDLNAPRDSIGPYHLKQADVGVPDDPSDPNNTFRLVLPAAMQSIAYEQPEPTTNPQTNANGVIDLRGQLIIPCGSLWRGPILPPPTVSPSPVGIIGQGIFPHLQAHTSEGPNQAIPGGPAYEPFWFDAEGDDMVILATRVNQGDGLGSWDFTDPAIDLGFSNTYGTNNGQRPPVPTTGIFVFTGSAP